MRCGIREGSSEGLLQPVIHVCNIQRIPTYFILMTIYKLELFSFCVFFTPLHLFLFVFVGSGWVPGRLRVVSGAASSHL
jgi:hypothetical protein